MEARCDSFDHVSAGVVVLCTSLSQPISSTAARKTRFANRGQYADQIHIKVECYRLCNRRQVIILSCDFGYPGWSVRVDLELSRTAYLSLPYLCLGTGAVWTLIHRKPGNGPSSRGRVAPQERSSQPSCMFVEVRNSSYAATRNPAGNRKSQNGNSAAKAAGETRS